MRKQRNAEKGRMTIVESVKKDAGLYTLSQAAMFARIPVNTLNYWHYGTKDSKPLREAQICKDEGKFITFLEFVEALAIRSLRTERNIPLPKIREAITEAQQKYQIQYPFAQQKHKAVIVGRDLHILLNEDVMVGLSGKDKKQRSFKAFLEPYMEQLKFDDHKVACEYIAYRYGAGDKIIRMNPRVGFGEPLVGNSGYTAETLWRAALAEGSFDKASEYYEIDRESVVAACNYWEGLSAAA
jgi:uncharacterized protein (DUF433 family)